MYSYSDIYVHSPQFHYRSLLPFCFIHFSLPEGGMPQPASAPKSWLTSPAAPYCPTGHLFWSHALLIFQSCHACYLLIAWWLTNLGLSLIWGGGGTSALLTGLCNIPGSVTLGKGLSCVSSEA